MEAEAKVKSILIYPIKSCRGISVSRASLTPTGFRWDRNWLVVNSKGRAYTQRNTSKLSLVQVELPHDAFVDGWEPTNDSFMEIEAPGMDVLKIPLLKEHTVTDGVSVWEWCGSALDEGDEAEKWFSNFLDKPSRLVRFNAATETRPVDPNFARGHNIMFSDLFPYLLISKESLDALNNLLKEPVPINRFRPNIFIDGCEPFSEDLWKEIEINKFAFESVRLCSRCKIPTINQDDGVAGLEPNETLMKIRSDHILGLNTKHRGEIYFGQNLVWKANSNGNEGNIINVGDPIFVVKKVAILAEAVA